NDELALRPCMLNDEWTFYRNGNYYFNARGDYWAEGGIFNPQNICADTSSMLGTNGEDLSSWGGGMHTFVLTTGSTPTIKSVGLGAFIGFFKLGNDAETHVPLNDVTYNIVKLTDGDVDTLVIEGNYHSADPTFTGGYWRFTLMHYDNPASEPPIPGNKPNASFTFTNAGLAVTYTNTTTGGSTYAWDFGDGQTSTAQSPVHTYAAQGIYNVTMTATNSNGSSSATNVVFLGVDLTTLSDAQLQGGAWKVRVEEKSIFVGGGMGSSAWWSLPKAFMVSGTGTDDWTCIADDEFKFSAGGGFSYDTKGSARNDGYFGSPNGCISDANIASSGNGAAFGTCATHTYVLTPGTASARPVITLTHGAGFAAFLGFYKGYYGGENTDATKLPDNGATSIKYEVFGYANSGTKEYLFVSVDISANHDGTAAWSAILER
ncbi:MAG: PKD domain-containing protein, partial [Bacteroidota bacterium]